ncbi:MAG TPA: hypothetical protein VHT97_07325, partial [Acidimicrobiales bacterium]|nr:hypothetical protein [Acidimicrobiales bacterium]
MLLTTLLALGGAGAMLAAALSQRRDQLRQVDDLVGLMPLPAYTADEELSPLTDRAIDLAGQAVDRMGRGRSLRQTLERAQIPLRPGEFVIVVVGGALAVAALTLLVTGSRVVAVGAAVGSLGLVSPYLRR